MPTIDISDSVLERLQNAAPPSDTSNPTAFDTTLANALDFYEVYVELCKKAKLKAQKNGKEEGTLYFNNDSLPNVRHAKILGWTFGTSRSSERTWDALQRMALVMASAECGSREELRRMSGANIVAPGDNRLQYTEVQGQGFCFQRLGSERVLEIVRNCARLAQCSVSLELEWPDRADADHPGKKAILEIDY